MNTTRGSWTKQCHGKLYITYLYTGQAPGWLRWRVYTSGHFEQIAIIYTIQSIDGVCFCSWQYYRKPINNKSSYDILLARVNSLRFSRLESHCTSHLIFFREEFIRSTEGSSHYTMHKELSQKTWHFALNGQNSTEAIIWFNIIQILWSYGAPFDRTFKDFAVSRMEFWVWSKKVPLTRDLSGNTRSSELSDPNE